MGVAWKQTVTGLVALLICSSNWIVVGAEKPKSAAANDAADLTSDHSKGASEPLQVQLTKWLNSVEGGVFNTKQEVRAVNDDSDGGNLFYGIFAKEFIKKGDVLARIPWEYIITDEEDDEELYEDDFEDAVLKCGTARNLAREMKQVQTLGKYIKDPTSASKYGPYIQYVLDQPSGIIPSAWSLKGRMMFQDVLGGKRQSIPPNYATTWLEEDWYDDCNGDPKDELSAKAAMTVVSRADDDLLVPVYDMYNHRNGKFYNTHMKITRGESYLVSARRDIEPGEQLYNSYNMCENCGGRKDGYGTPEVFRDYGFVEDFPQRWNFEEHEFLIDLSETETGDIRIQWVDGEPENDKDKEETKQIIMKELQRLTKTKNGIWKTDFIDAKSTIKESEWKSLWDFHQAMVNALSYAFNDICDDESEMLAIGEDTCTLEGMCGGINYFDDLDWEDDKTKYNIQTCDNKEIMTFPDYWMLEGMQTHYQQLNFAFNKEIDDICMDLEDTVQICSSYRPHYHEYSSHFAARFVDNVKRVVFVGGGDSMMLHEVLKYPSLEKVVGLELDQMVVRKSFKYFRTQAHFDNDKVEWWFGDATKSLLLLPEDYWGSFDLVIVDLSETVMAFSVTEELDVFDALALLLNPEGVMVKNEHYMETMSRTFDYTLQVYLGENPKICSQCMIFGSNKADFFHKPVVEHGVETLLLPPVAELKDGFDFFHDFRKNDAIEQGKCNLNTKKKNVTTQTKSAGLLHILDAEDLGVKLDNDTVRKIIIAAAKAEGFTKIEQDFKFSSVQKIATSKDAKSSLVSVVFKEGYVSARIWPEFNYVAVDVGVWGSFQDADKLRFRIGSSLKAETKSYFRVVVGGMFGSSTWEKDKDIIGPQIVQQRNCEESEDEDADAPDDSVLEVIIDEAATLVGSGNTVAAVFCGVEGEEECLSADVLGKHPEIGKVIPVWTCPVIFDLDESEKFGAMTKCEDQVLSTLMQGRGATGEGIGLVVFDDTADIEMGQILHSILTVESHREMLMSGFDTYFISLAFALDDEDWRFNFLERYRKEILYDPVLLAQYDVNVEGAKMELIILSRDENVGFKSTKALEEKLGSELSKGGTRASVEVVKITGGLFNFMHDYNPHEYLQEDYPSAPGNKQWEAQKSLGRKTVVQYDKAPGKQMPDTQDMAALIDTLLDDSTLYQFEVYTEVGDGVVIVSDTKAGSVIAVWDGRDHIDLNVFMHDDMESVMKIFLEKFEKLAKKKVNMGLRDDFPRGTGRVMNFREDMTYGGVDSILELKPYVDLGDDED
jgi:spermidine synthase/S-adenosylmethionine/arginine decarboxylase-like enzyme